MKRNIQRQNQVKVLNKGTGQSIPKQISIRNTRGKVAVPYIALPFNNKLIKSVTVNVTNAFTCKQ
eukprot:Pgem_evm2s11705